MKVFLATLLTLAALRAQAPPRDVATVATPTGTAGLSGRVIDDTGQPVPRALVTIQGDMRLTVAALTDDAGGWTFGDLPAGRFTITARKAGHPDTSYGAQRPNRPGAGIQLAAAQIARDLRLTLPRGAALSGIVMDDRGQPMPDVPVMAWEVRTSLAGERTLEFPSTGGVSVRTDDRGMYRVYGLPAGEYTVGTAWFYSGLPEGVRVPTDDEIRTAFAANTVAGGATAPPRRADQAPPVEYNFTMAFHPGTPDPMTATTVPLAAGDDRSDVNLQMQFRPLSKITGTFTGPDGPLSRVSLSLIRKTRVASLNTTTQWPASTSPFTTNSLPPGEYALRATAPPEDGRPALWAGADVSISGTEPVTVSLVLAPAMTITGQVTFADGATPPPDVSTLRVTFFPLEGGAPSTSVQPTVDPTGRVTITGVSPGRYRLGASVPAATPGAGPVWVLASVTSQGMDLTDRAIEVSEGLVPALELTFTDRVSELSGMLADASGRAAPNYFVIAVPADDTYWLPQSRRIVSTRPDVTGHYRFRGLPPGTYRVALTTDLISQDLSDRSALTRITTQSTPVTIVPGEIHTLNLVVPAQ